MAQPYVGEIRMFAGNFAPAGWMFCEGALLPISENETLFNLIGTTYGGDGQSTFALPDLRGRVPVHQGSANILAQAAGVEEVTLGINQTPNHTHAFIVSSANGTDIAASGNTLGSLQGVKVYRAGTATVQLDPSAVTSQGGSQPHNNFQPYLCIDFIISLFGIFPSQT
ncbi:MAG TPA: tail fiber protein [Allosphingosinicella sp.]|nr:tail fiber protein [Allosphingosinicella sp.]